MFVFIYWCIGSMASQWVIASAKASARTQSHTWTCSKASEKIKSSASVLAKASTKNNFLLYKFVGRNR